MSLTNYLLLIVIVLLLRLIYPDELTIIGAVGLAAFAVYGVYWVVAKGPAKWKTYRAQQDQEKRDDDEYWEYVGKQ